MGTPFLSEIKIVAFNYAPKGWALCNGQLLPINQNQALFSLLGTNYGGDGRVNFALPDLRGRVAMSQGNSHALAERGGEEAHTLTIAEMPGHIHQWNVNSTADSTGNQATADANSVFGKSIGRPSTGSNFPASMYDPGPGVQAMAGAVIGNAGGSQAHPNMQPYLTLNFCIALQGVFPSQN